MLKYASIGRNIFIVDKYFKLFFRNSLKNYDLNTAEGMVLLALFGQDGKNDMEILSAIHYGQFNKTQDQIIDELHYDKSVMARTMQSLENKGYVLRNDNPEDSRSYIFTITEKAQNFKPKLIEVLSEWNNLLLKDVENLEIVKSSLEKMCENVKYIVKGA